MSPLLGFFLSAVLGILSFPPIGLWPLAYVAMVPFLLAAVALPPRQARRRAYLAGLVFFAGLLYWIGFNSGAPALLSWLSALGVVLILASVWGFTAWAVSGISRRFGPGWAMVIFVSFYLFQEVFWGTGEMGFPWAVWGLSQIGFLPAVQMADLGDIFLISLWVLVLNALIFLWWTRGGNRRRLLITAILVFVLPVMYGVARMWEFSGGDPVPVAAVQANTPVEDKWQMAAEDIAQSYLDYSWPLLGTDTRLVVWPETATPTALRYREWLRNAVQNFADSSGMSLLTGATDWEVDPERGRVPFNAAFLIRPGVRDLIRAAKIRLVPFGERIPGQAILPFLKNLHLGQAEWMPGKEVVVFPAHNGLPPFGCLICFEVVFPEIASDMVRRGALVLTNITNDGWYSNTSGPYQHLALTQIRAVAMRRSIVRSANTGISALVLPTGKITRRLAYDTAGQIYGTVPARPEISLAVVLNRIWLPFYSLILIGLLVYLWITERRGTRIRIAAPGAVRPEQQ